MSLIRHAPGAAATVSSLDPARGGGHTARVLNQSPRPARAARHTRHALFAGAAALLATSIGIVAQRQGPGPGGNGGGPQAVPGLTVAQQQAFAEGTRVFGKDYTEAEGLGPVFNDESCADCHRGGGDSNRTVQRFGRVAASGFDALDYLGGSLVQARGIGAVTTADGTHTFRGETVPADATVRAQRKSQSLLGLGFVDAVPDDTFRAVADEQQASDPATAGRVQLLFDPTTGGEVVGRFGWKAQVPSLRAFAGDALLNEMGITSPGFRDEICPQGDCLALGFNPAPALNDDGNDAAAITDFMTMLAPAVPGPEDAETTRGATVFQQTGCATCHRPTLQTGPSAVRALNQVTFHPYSDFLLHDMGSLGDGIVQGAASGREMRTAPLWGVQRQTRFLHDGSADTLEEAITRHDGQGRAARDGFTALSEPDRNALLAFLRTR